MARKPVSRSEVTCFVCGKAWMKRDSDIARLKTGHHFCSKECQHKVPTKPRRGETKECLVCGSKVYRNASQIRDRTFCSRACLTIGLTNHAPPVDCATCGEAFKYEAGRREKYCSRSCWRDGRYRRQLGRTHNGLPAVVDSGGYVRIYEPNHPNAYKSGWVLEHRHVAETALGRFLETSEIVHHINHVRTDNRPENLQVLGASEHSRLTGSENVLALKSALDMRAKIDEYERRFGPL